MAIRIRQTPYKRTGGPHVGPYPMHADEVRAQLSVIAMAGSQDLPGALGEDPDADPEYTRITYDPGPQDSTTPSGRVRQRLKDMVDSAADIILFGVGPGFTWSDGSTIEDSAGAAIGKWIFYDTQNCNGGGRWIRGTDGNEVCTTSAGILYHELGHAFLNHGAGAQDDDERAAVTFENDLRVSEGLVPRDPDHWPESDCGCPNGCCIVASVATGSPFSAEVHALRRFRDRTLRKTALGMHFFDALHREYYSFSVDVSRILVTSQTAREQVAAWLVQPLICALELAQQYARLPEDELRLGELVARNGESTLELASPLAWRDARNALEVALRGQPLPAQLLSLEPAVAHALLILREKLPLCPHVRWAIIDPLRLYAAARESYGEGQSAASVGRGLRLGFDEWAAALPLQYLQEHLTPDDWARDLSELATTFFTSLEARHRFGERLWGVLPRPIDEKLELALRREGYVR